jgi:hypothetical protein
MMATDKPALFAIVFTVSFAAIYAVCTELNLPAVTYHPVIGEIDALWKPERRGPAMYWYGWMLTSLAGAALLAAFATITPEKWLQRTITFGALLTVAYLIVSSLAFFVYERATVELEFLRSRWLSVALAVVLAGAGSFFVPASWGERLSPVWTWVVPLGALAVLGYYLVPYFTR